MRRKIFRSQIHRATVTQANLHYVGSVTVDLNLLEAADILPGEVVAISDLTNGSWLETYVIAGERGSGVLGINGAAAHLVHVGDTVDLHTYGEMTTSDASSYRSAIVHVDDSNFIVQMTNGGRPQPAAGAAGTSESLWRRRAAEKSGIFG